MKHSVLIVDDEKAICDSIVSLLADKYKTFQACSAREAIDIVNENKNIDVMLCDLIMPEMNGNEMIEEIRSGNRDISMIVMTAYSDPARVCDAMKKGASNFLFKPLDLSTVETSIKNAIHNKQITAQSTNGH